ncbi:hypothetical protein TorRG33x02_195120 [Trema orientale]|uniref:Uncharacterized protein n=1 Tax=Trema orientale TaxID=63057 RepID=A0A2P5EGL3_TREOI|nr:hypothetical protein TorRG33x02_195120 [Trema orientale]
MVLDYAAALKSCDMLHVPSSDGLPAFPGMPFATEVPTLIGLSSILFRPSSNELYCLPFGVPSSDSSTPFWPFEWTALLAFEVTP